VALYPRVGDFYIQVILNAEQEKKVYSEISNCVLHEKLSATPTIVEGKWLYVTFLELGSVDILVKLLNIRMEIAPNKRLVRTCSADAPQRLNRTVSAPSELGASCGVQVPIG
jgi:hypothetical protein